MAERRKSARRFAVCICNDGYEASSERHKLYVVEPDPEAESDGDIRVVDESGEDYLYPSRWFVAVEVPKAVQASLLRSITGRSRTAREVNTMEFDITPAEEAELLEAIESVERGEVVSAVDLPRRLRSAGSPRLGPAPRGSRLASRARPR